MVEVRGGDGVAELDQRGQQGGRVRAAGYRDNHVGAAREQRGGGGWDRTSDAAVMSRVLYH